MDTEESRLTQIGESFLKFATEKSKKKIKYILYRCTCGNEKEIQPYFVQKGITKSCGCLTIEKASTHGLRYHRLYGTWREMVSRCTKETNTHYNDYGGRGISVCTRWIKLENFIEDMYPTFEEGLSLDRINNDKGYEPKNCRWVTRNIQMRNTRKLSPSNTSGYRGVSFRKDRSNWSAQISVNNIYIYLGRFKTPLDGAKAYDSYVIKNNLEHTINGVLFSELIYN